MKNFIFLSWLFISSSSFCQYNPEQSAFDYFFQHIIEKDYPSGKIKFSGFVEQSTSGSFSGPECLTVEERLSFINGGFKEKPNVVKIIDGYSKIRKSDRQQKLMLNIYQPFRLNSEKNIITIVVSIKHQRGTSYYLILNNNSEVIDWCKSNFII